MSELKDILLKKENNLVLAQDLSKAMYEAKAHLVHELWNEIDSAVKGVEDFPAKSDEESKVSLDEVRSYVKSWRNYSRLDLSYPAVPLGTDARLYAEVLGYEDKITIGLRFIVEKDDKQVEDLQKSFKIVTSKAMLDVIWKGALRGYGIAT